MTDNTSCAEILNTFFIESVQNLKIDREMYVNKVTILDDPIDSTIDKDNPSILRISQKQFPSNSFSFACVCEENVAETIKCLNSKKAYQENNIPPTILIENADICAAAIQNDIKRNVENGSFPANLKNADITLTFKKDRLLNANYRPS